MPYTVKKLAKASGVSVRTLHHYDEVGLLNPAYCGANGYRFYEEEQVLRLQQILFYRELGIGLKQIQEILERSDFDKVSALESHRKGLIKELARKRDLIATIGKTIEHLKGTKAMDNKEMFKGFDPEQQRQHEQYLVDRYGDDMKESIAKSKSRVKDWSKEKWERTRGDFADTSIGSANSGHRTESPTTAIANSSWTQSSETPTQPTTQNSLSSLSPQSKRFRTLNSHSKTGPTRC
jgi:DNA-binding transcriptional MerR regulator